MVYRNDYTALVVVFLIVLLCVGLLGALVYDKVIQMLTPSSALTGQTRPVPYAAPAPAQQSPVPQPTATSIPTRTPTSHSAMATAEATFVYQTVAAGNVKATLDKVQAEATKTWLELETQRHAALVTGQLEDENATRENTNRREMITDALLVIGVVGTLACLALGVVRISQTQAARAEASAKEADAKLREAEAKAAVEQRRLMEVQAAVRAKEQLHSAQIALAPISSSRIPGNGSGNGHGNDNGHETPSEQQQVRASISAPAN